MKCSIWLKNLEGKLFEVDNTLNSELFIAEKKSETLLNCNKNDLIMYSTPSRLFQSCYEVIYKSDNKAVTEAIIDEITRTLKEKSQLLKQRQALKKMNDVTVYKFIEDINSQLRNEYFELDIEDLMKRMELN
ncbi:hypothetical protein [Lysinibacillus sp. NPDC093216]|uniref:hypothetical protein n=1 Tax=Lysinibacillus sp. NPDC093216 TaxID=3390576 RepID=UPI003D088AAA